jgi:thymidylate synthase
VINIWRENPRPGRDIPCTLSLQFLVRAGEIHAVVSMRSSDAWLGWPFDVFSFSMVTCWVALLIRERIEHYDHGRLIARQNWPDAERQKLSELKLGALTLNAGSQHLYERDFAKAEAALATVERSHAPLDPLASFANPDEFPAHLGISCLTSNRTATPFLSDLVR